MIFITVGTHEQPMNRIFETVDKMIGSGEITEKVIAQSGYSTYKSDRILMQKFMPFDEMQELMGEANLVITHGGAATYLDAIEKGNSVIVVPRLKKFNEHVNDHQYEFLEALRTHNISIPFALDNDDLRKLIIDRPMPSKFSVRDKSKFMNQFELVIAELIGRN
ncbi:glycosyltransferase [Weissella confusa]|uniref:Multidrug MFS transporter n=1 Tax=Weissella confusa TaxID=1583 RepID=A0A4Z0RV10_WEICO|nr:glycosyltransferase [Weissella confusa]TGE71790.1 multidrug MFS transporter [Weissella confusa]